MCLAGASHHGHKIWSSSLLRVRLLALFWLILRCLTHDKEKKYLSCPKNVIHLAQIWSGTYLKKMLHAQEQVRQPYWICRISWGVLVRHLKINQNRVKCLTINGLEPQMLWEWREIPARHIFVWSWGAFHGPQVLSWQLLLIVPTYLHSPSVNTHFMLRSHQAKYLQVNLPADKLKKLSASLCWQMHPLNWGSTVSKQDLIQTRADNDDTSNHVTIA